MREHKDLTTKIENLQSSSLNCGGMWKVRVINKVVPGDKPLELLITAFKENPRIDELSKHKEFEEKGEWNPYELKLTRKIKLIEINDWKNYLNERIDHWSEFELISKAEMTAEFKKDVFDNNKAEFLNCLSQEMDLSEKQNLFRLDESTFDTYDIWWHQIQEDLIFELDNQLLIINFGWSS